MNSGAKRIQRTYLTLLLGNTLAASLIWGINTLFLLDAGLSNLQAFAANAFFTAGMVIFEIPTGIIADAWGRRTSYLLGTVTLAASTGLYYLMWSVQAPFWAWALVSVLLGLGFTFFSGAVEAWLVDALKYSKFTGNLETVFSRGQIVSGLAMLTGSVAGGVIAQATSLGVPFLLRAGVLIIVLVIAARTMRDIGFSPEPRAHPLEAVKNILSSSIKHGLGNRPVRWVMLAAPFTSGVGFYAFYAMQPYLLNLYGNPEAYAVAGLAAAVIACSQILGGLCAVPLRRLFEKRTTMLLGGLLTSAILLILLGATQSFGLALALLVLWGLIFAALTPVRQAYLNDMIPSKQRATVLSFDSLMGSSGGVVVQPVLGRAADIWSYGTSYFIGGAIQLIALPLIWLSRREQPPADLGTQTEAELVEEPPLT